MRKLTAVLLVVGGLAGVGAGGYDYATKYSPEKIFARQGVAIEHKFRTTRRKGKSALQRGKQLKEARYKLLREKLEEMKDAPSEKLCRFEKLFNSRMDTDSYGEALEALNKKNYSPFESCTTSGRINESATKPFIVGSILALIIGGIALFLMRERKVKTKTYDREMQKHMKKMEKERKAILKDLGFSKDEVEFIVTNSLAYLSVYDVTSSAHSITGIVRILNQYGFSESEVKKLLTTYPQLVNLSPEEITTRLTELEKEGPADHVRKKVLHRPALLGLEHYR